MSNPCRFRVAAIVQPGRDFDCDELKMVVERLDQAWKAWRSVGWNILYYKASVWFLVHPGDSPSIGCLMFRYLGILKDGVMFKSANQPPPGAGVICKECKHRAGRQAKSSAMCVIRGENKEYVRVLRVSRNGRTVRTFEDTIGEDFNETCRYFEVEGEMSNVS